MDLKNLIQRHSRKILNRISMDLMLEAYLTHESSLLELEDIPQTVEPVWILGKKYSAIIDIQQIRNDIQSRLWFTYRKGFLQIGNSNFTSDRGWGCMLRCGQMVIGQALIFLHLGRDWRWNPDKRDIDYLKILRMFEDKRSAPYSIHQIALTGVSHGKQIGEWFGPNTIAQVLKKLASLDEWSSIVFHVALDNTLVINEVLKLCNTTDHVNKACLNKKNWKPLVLVIPLRLGISTINPAYIKGVKMCFTFPQSLGIIGGRPNHALYFIGFVGNDVIFLDPHTTQQIGMLPNKDIETDLKIDNSYHCQQVNRLPILNMDPSLAACFLCKTEDDFHLLCHELKVHLVQSDQASQSLITICDDRPIDWTLDSSSNLSTLTTSYEAVTVSLSNLELNDKKLQVDSDDDFEIL
ncbi:cysteine protease ATG4B-like [Daktulosphaira vitifoliae]|uniref:cysteine protease ATG4B-like n=1 Tax=Daktulosphaira vitifoliae TaxID=58002 RepID=UPI0021AAE1FA|nr:cysteine protease ATG4B-like [Daktulosphaira vitifoliae]XP_050528848.1 cysteine protease ATG4B-like [Daktulosphaira vitifoliae]XP_050528849.1 cysteine protease ATG4B-like [Daktulosphaira vitifoliae]XP_050528850.1 cysteine protease ATG4B-like [Daktulosphaira vitifoliae]XP_050528851.1 cysteine protease ATG4B-like [Daktulosphaira vitifoliae]